MENISILYLTQPFQSLEDWEKVVRKNTGGQGESAWTPTQWMRKCSQTPKNLSGSCRAHSNWTCWDWSRNLSFPAGTRMAFVVTFFLSSSSQCPCEDLGQNQVPEDFLGTEVTIWVCSAHILVPSSHEHFGMYFMMPWLEQGLSFLSHCRLKVHCFSQLPLFFTALILNQSSHYH